DLHGGLLLFARRARPDRLEAGLLTSGWASPTGAPSALDEAALTRTFPGLPVLAQWHFSGSLPGHSGATVPDLHRLPSFRLGRNAFPPRTTGRLPIRLARIVRPSQCVEGTGAG